MIELTEFGYYSQHFLLLGGGVGSKEIKYQSISLCCPLSLLCFCFLIPISRLTTQPIITKTMSSCTNNCWCLCFLRDFSRHTFRIWLFISIFLLRCNGHITWCKLKMQDELIWYIINFLQYNYHHTIRNTSIRSHNYHFFYAVGTFKISSLGY